ncbi:hypothetical protein [Streptomyces sp. H27-D2]|uniref:hypothetical protein n=1 Tax=Streptomyces sp. H27-D2 TaxID=3046304 RepID=UPI002DBEA987|nr:hypothetical protein [Streptomyces sp. H27-D2]MEC4017328.1 hypothetical protein [Streptomyces sp. H27-D2]
MNRSGVKRARIRATLFAAAAVLAVVPMAGVSAAAQATERAVPSSATRAAGTPVGKWALQVQFEGQTYTSTVQFTPKGKAFLVFGGAGAWTPTGPNRFTFRISEPMFDPNGNYLGWVDVSQSAVQDGDTFTSSGTSRQYDQNDRLVRTVQATDTGTRS